MNTKYYELLFRGIDSDDRVIDIVRGYAWTAAILSNGNVGVAMHTEGETVSRMFPSLVGMKISQAAYAVMSWNMEEASEGMAVVNAYYNTRERTETLCTGMSFSGALDGLDISGKTIGLVGHLVNHSGINQQLLEKAGALRLPVLRLRRRFLCAFEKGHLHSPPEYGLSRRPWTAISPQCGRT